MLLLGVRAWTAFLSGPISWITRGRAWRGCRCENFQVHRCSQRNAGESRCVNKTVSEVISSRPSATARASTTSLEMPDAVYLIHSASCPSWRSRRSQSSGMFSLAQSHMAGGLRPTAKTFWSFKCSWRCLRQPTRLLSRREMTRGGFDRDSSGAGKPGL